MWEGKRKRICMHESTGIEEDLRRKWEEGRRVEKPPKLKTKLWEEIGGNNLTLAELGGYRED